MAFLDRLGGHGDRVSALPAGRDRAARPGRAAGQPRPGTLVYCCGPEPLLAAVEERCAGWPAGSLHVERFAPRTGEFVDDDFEVELARSGRVVPVPAGVSILSAVQDAGVSVLSSCQEGTCGTCETGVLRAGSTTATRYSPTPSGRSATS